MSLVKSTDSFNKTILWMNRWPPTLLCQWLCCNHGKEKCKIKREWKWYKVFEKLTWWIVKEWYPMHAYFTYNIITVTHKIRYILFHWYSWRIISKYFLVCFCNSKITVPLFSTCMWKETKWFNVQILLSHGISDSLWCAPTKYNDDEKQTLGFPLTLHCIFT